MRGRLSRSLRRAASYAALLLALLPLLATFTAASAGAQSDSLVSVHNDSVSVRLVDVDLRAAVQALGHYLDHPVIVTGVNGARVTLETSHPVARAAVPGLLRGLLGSQGIELKLDSASGTYRLTTSEPAPAPMPPPSASATAPIAPPPLELFVIRLRHAKAADVAATVNALYGRASAFGEPVARLPTLSRELQMQSVAPASGGAMPPAVPLPNGAPLARSATLAGDVTIVPDARANSLLVRASRADFALVRAAVDQIDIRPLQVLIEVLIAELRRDRSFQFGVGAELAATPVKGTGNMTIGASTAGGEGIGDFVLRVMGIGGVDVDATLRAAESRGDARIVSRPVLLAANNEPAEINVGSQRPFVQVARVLPTDNTARDQVVQYKDVGTRLHVVPTISDDAYVMLQVTQEVNAATAELAFDAPIISTRSVDTRLLVRDGQTIVLGGLTDRQRDRAQGGVPLLSRLPLLGGLFGHASRHTTETELYLFLTPRIIGSDAAADTLTAPRRRRAGAIEHD